MVLIYNNKVKILCYTFNNNKNIDKLIKLGVDCIISDYPDRIK